MIYIGIDAGKNGGIAVKSGKTVVCYKMPATTTDLRDLLQTVINGQPCLVALEKLNLHASDQSERGKVLRMQKLMANFATIQAVLELLGSPYCLVHPRTWQSKIGLKQTGLSKQTRKNLYKAAATMYYPEVKATLWNADAILIMQFVYMASICWKKWLKENMPEDMFQQLLEWQKS